MDLTPIDADRLDAAIALLCEGFPDSDASFWREGLGRARTFCRCRPEAPLGYLMYRDGVAIGVILSMISHRPGGDGAPRKVVNISSWYVAEGQRQAAPMMLMKMLRDKEAVYTDLTASSVALQMNLRLGFQPWNEGVLVTSWPLTLLGSFHGSRVVDWTQVPRGTLADDEMQLLADHDRLGCVCTAWYDGRRWQPVVWMRTRIRRLPAAHLIYAPSRAAVIRHLRGMSAYLLRRGLVLVSIDADARERPRGALFRIRSVKTYRGAMDRDRIDYAYSELVILGLRPY